MFFCNANPALEIPVTNQDITPLDTRVYTPQFIHPVYTEIIQRLHTPLIQDVLYKIPTAV